MIELRSVPADERSQGLWQLLRRWHPRVFDQDGDNYLAQGHGMLNLDAHRVVGVVEAGSKLLAEHGEPTITDYNEDNVRRRKAFKHRNAPIVALCEAIDVKKQPRLAVSSLQSVVEAPRLTLRVFTPVVDEYFELAWQRYADIDLSGTDQVSTGPGRPQ